MAFHPDNVGGKPWAYAQSTLWTDQLAIGHKRQIPDSRVADYSVTSVDGPESAT